MRLNAVEFALMNNPVRPLLQRYLEAPILRRMGGRLASGIALEIGCGPGVGARLALELFGAGRVDGFDLDPRMVRLARKRLARDGFRARLWVGDAQAIAASADSYDAVFDYGVIHHVQAWRGVLAEVHRVLKPGGRFYAEEVLARFIRAPLVRHLLDHPQADRFDAGRFRTAMVEAGLTPVTDRELWGLIGWFVAEKPAPESPRPLPPMRRG